MWSKGPDMANVLFNIQTVINTTHNVVNKNMVELPLINNSTFAGYLHSRIVV